MGTVVQQIGSGFSSGTKFGKRFTTSSSFSNPACLAGKVESARNFLAEALESTPTLFGRLLMLAQAIDDHSGVYSMPLIDAVCGPRDSDTLLRLQHEEVLIQWLSTGMDQRIADLTFFLRKLPDGRQAVRELVRHRGYLDLLPTNPDPILREHFIFEVEQILAFAYARL